MNMRFLWDRPFETVFLACCTIPLLWFLGCLILNEPEHAGRGGAIGLTFSLGARIVKSRLEYSSIDALDQLSSELRSLMNGTEDSADLLEQNSARIEALKRDLARERERKAIEDQILAFSSAVSTVFWGFGDWAAASILLL